MKEKNIFEQVLKSVDSIKGIIKKRNWDLTQDLIIDKPATDDEINKVEKELGIKIPNDYKTLFKFSKHVEFRYQFDEEMPSEFRNNFSGELYWDLDRLVAQTESFKDWVETSLDPEYNDEESIEITRKIWKDKLPMIDVPNGDIIVIGDNPSEVIYFSHEGDTMHGKILGDNLWTFLEFHTKIGFAGSEDWQFEPFYDHQNDKMITQSALVDKFVTWLNK